MPLQQSAALTKLTELVKDIKIAMLTTVEADGLLHSRPMGTQEIEDGTLWFFVKDDSRKADEVLHDPRVNVSYINSTTWVSVSGRATITRDRQKIDELWSDTIKMWVPLGKADPHLALMKIDIEEGEYWDASSGAMVRLFDYVKSRLSGEAYYEGELTEHGVAKA